MVFVKKLLSALMIALILLTMIMLPKYAGGLVLHPSPLDFLKKEKEEFSGIINVWHIVGFKPYVGSLGGYLKKVASVEEKYHYGVYFSVESISLDDAKKRIDNGEFPDIISYRDGMIQDQRLMELGEEIKTVCGAKADEPLFGAVYTSSCELILYRREAVSDIELERAVNTRSAPSLDEFRANKAPLCITDARGAGDMYRLMLLNKADDFDVLAPFDDTGSIQRIGINKSIDDKKRKYALEFVGLVLDNKLQSELVSRGLLPVNSDVSLDYETSFLKEAYERLRKRDQKP